LTESGWLSRDGERLAPLEVASTFADRSRGLLGRDGLDGALLLRPASSVHTLRMRFAIDVAFCDRDLVVLDLVTMRRNRVGRPRVQSRAVLEAEAGRFDQWGLRRGDRLQIIVA
jgi:uncharacterized membrane protein (UPF0127 family)